MKKIYTLTALLAVLIASLGLTSCETTYGPPGAYYDSDLIGFWQLTRVNGTPVYGYQSNFLEFYRNGSGNYYYYSGGRQYVSPLTYSTDYYGGSSTIYIRYSDGSTVSADYWYNSNASRMYMQWVEYGQLVTYEYAYVNGVSWAPAYSAPAAAAAEIDTIHIPNPAVGLRPGGAVAR